MSEFKPTRKLPFPLVKSSVVLPAIVNNNTFVESGDTQNANVNRSNGTL